MSILRKAEEQYPERFAQTEVGVQALNLEHEAEVSDLLIGLELMLHLFFLL